MSSNNDGIIVILSSPSGAGKTTLVNLILQNKKFVNSVSHTTRKPRSNEINGKDYYFVSNEEFKNLIKNNEFLEYANVFNNFYGSTKKPVLENLQNGNNVVFDIDWQGTEQIKSQNIKYKIITFFVLPPSKEILYERLTNRDMKDKLIASERMKQFYKDVKHWVKTIDAIIPIEQHDIPNNLIKSAIENIPEEFSRDQDGFNLIVGQNRDYLILEIAFKEK